MKLTGSLFCGNLRQGLLSRRFPLVAVATALLLWLPFIPATGVMSVIDAFDFSITGGGVFVVILGILPLLPFACSYASDHKDGVVRFFIIRAGVGRYIACKFAAAVVCAMTVFLLGVFLYSGILFLTGMPFWDGLINNSLSYAQLLEQNNPWGYYLIKVFHYACSAAWFAALGMWISSLVPDVYVTLAAPVVLYMMALCLSVLCGVPWQYSFTMFGEGIHDMGTPQATLLFKIGITLASCLLLGWLSIQNVKRRVRHA